MRLTLPSPRTGQTRQTCQARGPDRCAPASSLRGGHADALSCAVPAALMPGATFRGHPRNACVTPMHRRSVYPPHPHGLPTVATSRGKLRANHSRTTTSPPGDLSWRAANCRQDDQKPEHHPNTRESRLPDAPAPPTFSRSTANIDLERR